MVFIATPHRGSRVDRGGLQRLGARLVRLHDPLRASYGRLLARNGPDFFTERFRKGLPTSIDELEWQSPILMGLDESDSRRRSRPIPLSPTGATRPLPAGATAWSRTTVRHLNGVASESLVSAGHLCQDHPAVIREVRRILVEHGVQ